MPLEFALRPRFNLERPPRRRRLSWLRLPPLVLPVAAYWLSIAGVTYGLIRAFAQDSFEQRGQDILKSRRLQAPPDQVPDDAAVSEPVVPLSARTAEPLRRNEEPATPSPIPAPSVAEPRGSDVATRHDPKPEPRVAKRELALRAEPPRATEREAVAPATITARENLEQPARPRSEASAREVAHAESSRGEVQTLSLPSCESAAAGANQAIDLRSARGAPDLTRDAFAAVFENGSYLAQCEIPGRTALEICAAVQNGKAVGVSVTTYPRNAAINACVRRAVAGLRFPRSSQLDVTRTRFEPAL